MFQLVINFCGIDVLCYLFEETMQITFVCQQLANSTKCKTVINNMLEFQTPR
jgi:hypothetical protein